MNFLYKTRIVLIFIFSIHCALLINANGNEKKPLNVLFIAADDLNCAISSYGCEEAITPNFDRLAAMGVQFDNAYCQQALCGPSRNSVMTGMRPNSITCYGLGDLFRVYQPNRTSLGEFFINQGYYSGRVGKIYHYGNPDRIGTDGRDDKLSWSECFNPVGIDKTMEEKIVRFPGGRTGKKGGLGISMSYWDPISEDDDHTDGKVATQAIQMIESNKDRPFFIAAGFFNPHCPHVAPKKYFDLYDINAIQMPDLELAKKDLEDVPPLALKKDLKGWPFWRQNVTLDEAKQSKLAYLATISFVDAQVGRLLDALEKNNLMDRTVIVFWSDHGYFIGEKGLWFKRKAFELSARVPLYIMAPGIKGGVACKRTVELIDLFPTIVDYAGFEVPTGLDGVSLRPLLENPNRNWERPAFTQVHHSSEEQGYSMRNEKWRYTEWNRGKDGVELYNHEMDPDEVHNLAKNPEFSSVVNSMSKELRIYSDTYKPRPAKKKKMIKKDG